MLRDSKSHARVPQAIESIDRNAEVLKTLVEDLIDMSRLTTGKLKSSVAVSTSWRWRTKPSI
jgi:signal transduction histidine kinase